MNKAVFLDKDGTINEDVGYLDDPAKLTVFPYSAQAIKILNDAGFKVIIVSNQAGIARGILTEDIYQAIDKKTHKIILQDGGIIDASYYCPHHPEHGIHPYRTKCENRKPNPGMLKKGEKEFDLDLSKCYMIGDKISDIQAGHNAGVKTILVKTGYGKDHVNNPKLKELNPVFIGENLLEAAEWIVKNEKI
ncbi:MAG: HAD family hydrolase [Candidatus Margulisbacteria bacterium]|nr:HAD family hydrolase [Candidatus Margulisiibacteriota bacterium]MBU1022162.1 HAD family hydrolase [Candidatus Margulisiibacteriota bacterium]MBU1729399.1 HAD family hydrolase [Candidatus Margulisiibacteriota bacterium]MBU1955672.1 HAD family hydrolase [Candidatus Margulisiibacteriota bacterium]